MGVGTGTPCCGGCNCLVYRDGSFQLEPHVRFDSAAFGLTVPCTRLADLTLWKGYRTASVPVDAGGSILMGLRVPVTGKPRLLCMFGEANALTTTDFDTLLARKGVLFECQSDVWTVLESNDFLYQAVSVSAATAAVDGVSAPQIYNSAATGVPDNVWCNPSYIPDPIELTFGDLVDETISGVLFNRSAFNGVGLSCTLASTSGTTRKTKRYTGTFYTNATAVCGGDPTARPHGTFRWLATVLINYPAVVDGTACTIDVDITEDSPVEFTPGCWKFGAGSGSPNSFRYKRFRWVSTFDKKDDGLLIGHFIPMFNNGQDFGASPDGLQPPFNEGRYYTVQNSGMTGSGLAIGKLL